MTIDKARLKALAKAVIDLEDPWYTDLQLIARSVDVAPAELMAALNPHAVMTLLAEIERLREDPHMRAIRSLRSDCADLMVERDQLRTENEALRNALGDLLALYEDDEGCRNLPEYIAGRAAMAKEVPHG
ncbi:hypothetical protein [Pseudomonas sp. PS01300]|uniref:hypothetical protein n=1 Tax=Pseudomonas sp. PS01300 TaxID=2991436 RepID=UPI00249C9CFC|nr:hypothetical protein [Pseudomonas sp. PS01300]